MGLFSQKKQIFVSSVVYNLAGAEEDRVNYLRTTVTGSLLSSTKRGLGETLTSAYLGGPGIKFRGYGRWARNSGYANLLGVESSALNLRDELPEGVLTAIIPHAADQTVMVQTAEIGAADYTYWVDRYMVANHPGLLETSYVCDFEESNKTVGIELASGVKEFFTIPDFDPAGQYLYVTYSLVSGEIAGAWVVGTQTPMAVGQPYPSTVGWKFISTNNWQRLTGITNHTDGSITATRQSMTFYDNGTDRSYRVDSQPVTLQTHSPLQFLIYKEGSGNPVMDALFNASPVVGQYLAPIPIRIDNRMVNNDFLPGLYELNKKAVKKSIRASYDELLQKVLDNPSLKDIDYAYVVFGVALNAKENASKRYLYAFFQEIMVSENMNGGRYRAWKLVREQVELANKEWSDWRAAQADPGSPLYNTVEPSRVALPPPPSFTVQVAARNHNVNFDMAITWNAIEETVGSGLKKPGAKVGEFWWEDVAVEEFAGSAYVDGDRPVVDYEPLKVGRQRLCWQEDHDTWRQLEIWGLFHRNMVYGGKSVDIEGREAIADPEESGFIVPIHEEVFKRMPLLAATQMSTSCAFLVFNCYKVVKQKWYQTDWFKIFLVIVVIVITVWTGGAAAGSVGLLGTNVAVGAAIGFTGTAAIIAGAVANAIAAMILTQIITRLSTAFFGDKIGMIVGVIASIIAVQVGTGIASGQSLSASFGDLMRVDNLMKLTMAGGNGYADYLKAGAQDTLNQTQQLVSDYSTQAKEIEGKFEELFGHNGSGIDPLQATNVASSLVMESPDSFLSRTLMTGGDLAALSNDMLTNFADITLRTDLPI